MEDKTAQKAITFRQKKYGIKAKIANFLTSRKGKLVVLSIKVDA